MASYSCIFLDTTFFPEVGDVELGLWLSVVVSQLFQFTKMFKNYSTRSERSHMIGSVTALSSKLTEVYNFEWKKLEIIFQSYS